MASSLARRANTYPTMAEDGLLYSKEPCEPVLNIWSRPCEN